MKKYRVSEGSRFSLNAFDPDDTSACEGGRKEGESKLATINERLETSQELLYAEGKHKLLVILQGMDTSGKDGTIRRVFEGVNPIGVRVASFKVPTEEELRHDFLWRVHAKVPGKGELVIFNRSHYEDVIVVRVHDLVPEPVWRARYDQINEFERLLSESGTTILKFFLHIDPEEQKKRLQARLDDPEKRWKFRHGDLEERKLWKDYMLAYEEALAKTTTAWAPWHVIPANAKWCRNLIIGTVIVDALDKLDMKYPAPEDIDFEKLEIE